MSIVRSDPSRELGLPPPNRLFNKPISRRLIEDEGSLLAEWAPASMSKRSMRMLDDDLCLAAQVHVPVLVTAASRNHRDMCARIIHASGARALGPFVTFPGNGAAAPVAGASSCPDEDGPASAVRLCRQFEMARGGTLFVDDIATLTADVQQQLLSLLLERALPHANSNAKPVRFDVRIIAGASRHLDAERATGAFCEPLFYRLNIVHVAFTDRGAERKAQ